MINKPSPPQLPPTKWWLIIVCNVDSLSSSQGAQTAAMSRLFVATASPTLTSSSSGESSIKWQFCAVRGLVARSASGWEAVFRIRILVDPYSNRRLDSDLYSIYGSSGSTKSHLATQIFLQIFHDFHLI